MSKRLPALAYSLGIVVLLQPLRLSRWRQSCWDIFSGRWIHSGRCKRESWWIQTSLYCGRSCQMQLSQSCERVRRDLMTFFVALKGLLNQVWKHSISRFWKFSLFTMQLLQLMHLQQQILMQQHAFHPNKPAVWGPDQFHSRMCESI